MATEDSPITTGPVSGTAIAIGHGASATVNVIYQHARPAPVSAEDLAAAQQLLASLPLDSLPDLGSLPPGSRMVFARNPLFTGRAPDLQQLARALKGEHTVAAISQVAAATGLGGIGKTQLAVEFAHRYGRYFAGGVFWLSLASAEDVKSQIAQCGGTGGLQLRADYGALKLDEQVALVLSEWQSPLPCLLIFDNCESEELLQQWRPPAGGSRILVTSRNAEWDLTLGVQTLALGVLTRAESMELLRKFRPDLTNQTDLEGLNAIAEELGDLPLALHLAGSYLRRYNVPTSELLADLRRLDLLTHPSLTGMAVKISPTNHENHVARTFAISYLHLNPENELDSLALKALARAACFAPGIPIPRWLLKRTLGEELPDLLAEESLHRLAELGLLAPGNDVVTLHRLLANFVRRTISEPTLADTFAHLINEEARRINQTGLPAPLRLWIAHLRYVAEEAERSENDNASRLYINLGFHLEDEADYVGAQMAVERALQIDEGALGPNHPDVARDVGNLGSVVYALGDYIRAQKNFERALQIDELVFGPNHPNVARDVGNLGSVLDSVGDYEGARVAHERALQIDESVFGPNHPNVARHVGNLGSVLKAQGDYAGARVAYERALQIDEVALGPNHPQVALTCNSLGEVLLVIGDYTGARTAFERALKIREAVFSVDHPKVASVLNNLGTVLHKQGNYVGANAAFERALQIWEKQLGSDHPNVAGAVNNLGTALYEYGDYVGARTAFERALQIDESVFGPDHPSIARDMTNLGEVLLAIGDYAGAQVAHERALRINESVFGPNHPDVARVMTNLGKVLLAKRDYVGALTAHERALQIHKAILGPHHPEVAIDVSNVGELLTEMGDYAGAQVAYEMALKIEEAAFGPDHLQVALTVNNLGGALHRQGDYAGAQATAERALRILEHTLGPDHPKTRIARNNLARLFRPPSFIERFKSLFTKRH